ncbi:hypothetical protein F5890DRAFT_1563214 [Lentinula detonsa]|uniref:Ras-GAP domain-containing protein n=1 Tax=Lentinula detonsa TaxID=2804962 RepID=A0AA38UV21_9AGAR|nr:hypothetical protein F5890DRAFT_1563214 [Lentinula detonsa]
MPSRRPSASAGIINNGSSASSLTRVHKASDSRSHHAIFGQSHSASSLNHGAPPTSQQKIVQVLVNRLKNKLPCNSGEPLVRLESDNATQQAVNALVNLAHEALDMIGFALGELLEKLTQQQDSNGVVSVETMQSQLFLLKVLSVAMTTRWQPNARATSRASSRPTNDVETARRVPGSSDSSTPVSWSEPPPLEEACAKYVLSVMILCLRQTVAPDPPLIMPSSSFGDCSFRDYNAELINPKAIPLSHVDSDLASAMPDELRTQPSSISFHSTGKESLSNPVPLSSNDVAYEKTPVFYATSTQALAQQIMKYAGKIIFHISASNWKLVLQRLRSRIHFLATHPDESSDSTDLMILGYSILDRSRLLQIMNELSSLLVNMRLEGLKAIATPLRYAIWSWIEHFPDEYNEVVKLRARMDGASGVFDFLYNKCLGSERVLWPTLAILQCVIPEKTSELQTGSTRANQTLVKFAEDLMRPSSHTGNLASPSLVCATDICRAAMYIQPLQNEVPLQMLAYDVAHEIKRRICNPNRKSFYESCNEINVAVWAEALVSVYRFLPEEDSHTLFSLCLEPERSDAVKLCAVRACLTLIEEASLFPWQRPLDNLETVVATRFRHLHKTCITRRLEVDQYGSAKKGATRPKIKRIQLDPLSDQDLLVLGILSVWRARSSFYSTGMPDNEFTMWTNASIRIFESSLDLAVKIAAASANTRTFELAFRLDFSDPSNQLILGWMKNSLFQMLASISTMLLHARTDLESQRLWSGIILRILGFVARKTDDLKLKSVLNDPSRVPPMILAEIALLVSLPSADSIVSHTAAKGLRLLAHIESQVDAPSNPTITEEDKSKRYPVYDRMGDPKVLIVGRVAHQKRVRKLLRLMPYCSAVNVAVWQECYARYYNLMEVILNIPDDVTVRIGRGESYQENVAQWQNYALFLAVTAASSIQDSHDLALLSTVIPQRMLPDSLRTMRSPAPLISTFVNDLTALLIFEDVSIRDAAREALGVDLNVRLHPKILKYFDEVVQAVNLGKESNINEAASNHESMLLFIDQFIAVLKLMVENSHGRIEDVLSTDISPTLLGLASYVTRFDSPESSRIKQKFCLLCDSVCGKISNLNARKDNDVRRDILETIMDWIVQPESSTDYGFNVYEVNLSCLRTIVKLLDRLQLRPADTSIAGDDSFHYVSRLFMKYSTVLLNSFEFCQSDLPTSDSVSDVGSIQNRMRTSQRETEVRDLVITGLSHLVSSNTESGFKQCLPLAYNEDNRKRTIFAHVFARILSQGTKFDPEDRTGPSSGQNRLAELVKESDMTLVLAVCETCPPGEVDSMIAVLLNLFHSRASLIKLIKAMIDREVARTENEAGLFRSNSTCTRFLSAFARIHGYNYLRTLITPLIKCMESLPPGQGYELDPAKAGQQNVAQNRRNVEFVARSFLEIIGSSTSALPSMFREICVHIASTVYERWPDAKFAALGAFVFLRFISPAVVAPETIDLNPPGDALRRGLTLIAKIIQNLANNIFFGKEAHMMVLNDFLRDHIAHVTRYLSELNQYTPGEDDDEEWLGTASDDTDIIVLHRFFEKHADKIGKELLSISKPSSDDTSALNGKRAWDGLCTLLVDLGPPIDVPKASVLDRKDHREYKELMNRYADRPTDSVQEFYCETVHPSESDGVVYHVFRLSKINVEALDMDIFMYHFFKLLSSPHYEEYDIEIIVDCTNFTSMSELPLRWLKFCAEVFPSDLRMKIARTHILNANSLMQKFLRRVYNICAGIGIAGELRAWSSIAELIPHIPSSVIESPPLNHALSLEQEQSDLFTDVTMKTHQTRTPVLLTVGQTHIRITSVRTLNISPGLACKSTEIILLVDVSDVYNVQTGLETNEFIIRRSRQGDTIYFTSPHRETIIRTIRTAKSGLKDQQMLLAERFMRFSNVPATLLHIGMLSVDAYDDELRAAAYDLLGAVCTYLNYDKSPLIAPKSGFVPGTINGFVIDLSTRLARFAPQLTLDFISEVVASMTASDRDKSMQVLQRINCLRYMSPWIKNLELFANPTSPLFERSGARLRDCIRVLTDLSVNLPEMATNGVQKYIWEEAGQLNGNIVDIVIDEMIRSATDGGIGTHRCEIVAHSIAAISSSSIAVRGRLFSKLRKAIIKASPRMPRVPSHNTGWPEVSTLIRIALLAGTDTIHPLNNQLYVPEIAHIVTLVAGVGSTLIRKSVYGIVINLVQSLFFARLDDGPAPELLQLVEQMTTQETILNLFGLSRLTTTSEYSIFDADKEKAIIYQQEKLTALLVRIMDVSSGSKGQLNVWKARWMSLATASAFQYSSMIQMRSFTALGALTTSDVDDDFMYQMLMAFRTALLQSDNTSDITALVTMLRCITKAVPGLQIDSRHIPQLFWLGVAFLQSSHMAFFEDAAALVALTMTEMEKRRTFLGAPVAVRLLEARSPIEEPAQQFDSTLQLSCDSNFSFSLAAVLFKGMRHSGLRNSAEEALRTLLRITTHFGGQLQTETGSANGDPVCVDPDALGYFLALLATSTTAADYRALLRECGIQDTTPLEGDQTVISISNEISNVPSVSIDILGINDSNAALLATSFIGVMLMTAQGDDAESEMLFSILADIAIAYPEIMQMAYESLQDRIKDTFANCSNPTIIYHVSNIIRVALDDGYRDGHVGARYGVLRNSSSTVNTLDDSTSVHGPGRSHLKALEDQGMQGLAKNFQFLPAQSPAAGKVLALISNLVANIVS